jgi:hypothetical protein
MITNVVGKPCMIAADIGGTWAAKVGDVGATGVGDR